MLRSRMSLLRRRDSWFHGRLNKFFTRVESNTTDRGLQNDNGCSIKHEHHATRHNKLCFPALPLSLSLSLSTSSRNLLMFVMFEPVKPTSSPLI